MHGRLARLLLLFAGLGFLLSSSTAHAVIDKPLPLKEILAYTPHIFVARVEKLNPGEEKATMVLKVEEVLNKKKPDFDKLRVVLEGTEESKKAKELPQLLKRLADDLPVVVFVSRLPDKKYMALIYTNGTWFQALNADPSKDAWGFTNIEPYLRRTYAGTTKDLRQIIVDGIDKKKAPPEWNKDEKPGVGPELKAGETPKKTEFRRTDGPVFGVIPTVAIGGPLAILSMLFPTLFGSPKEVMQRYMALLTVASINSMVYLLHIWLSGYDWFRTSLVGPPVVLWSFMSLTTLLGTVWAIRRHRAALAAGTTSMPARGEVVAYQLLSLVGLGIVCYAWGAGSLLLPGWVEMLLVSAVVWSGTLAILYDRWALSRAPAIEAPALPETVAAFTGADTGFLAGVTLGGESAGFGDLEAPANPPDLRRRPAVALEPFMLAALCLTCVGITWAGFSKAETINPVAIDPNLVQDELQPQFVGSTLFFQAADPGSLHSTPLVTEDRIYAAVGHRAGFVAFGRLYCLDRATSKEIWSFDDEGKMKQVFCSPCLDGDRIYIGEGYHQDSFCKMFCLDARTGKKVWEFQTKSHTESTPCVADGKVFFGAGDDGVYCVDAKDGKQVWHFPGLHVDTNPTVVGDRLYGGSAYGDQVWMFCLDTATGKPIWRQPSRLPVFGTPTVQGSLVFYGTGNGNMLQSDSAKPDGSLLCLKADTGELLWRFDTSDSILAKPAVDRRHVYAVSRNHHVYCLNRRDGQEVWKEDLGSPIVAAPALIGGEHGESYSLFVAASGGRVACLDPLTGKHLYAPIDVLARNTAFKKAELVSSPRVVITRKGNDEKRQVYFGAALDDLTAFQAGIFRIEDRF
ncbi:MAG: PQQ-like beta-propeller repeat protein, partial [Planctomycetia bacterium]|nr:PQQ-like beta-propeller repeat protein [Planctomycetia bacterium]